MGSMPHSCRTLGQGMAADVMRAVFDCTRRIRKILQNDPFRRLSASALSLDSERRNMVGMLAYPRGPPAYRLKSKRLRARPIHPNHLRAANLPHTSLFPGHQWNRLPALYPLLWERPRTA